MKLIPGKLFVLTLVCFGSALVGVFFWDWQREAPPAKIIISTPSPKVDRSWKGQLSRMTAIANRGEQREAMKNLAVERIKTDLEETLVAIEKNDLGGGAVPDLFIEVFFAQWAQTDSESAIKRAMNETDRNREVALRGIATGWALQLPDEADRQTALKRLASEWAKKDPTAATQWVLQLPGGGLREAALREVILACPPEEQAKITRMVMQMPNENSRNATLLTLFQSGRQENPADMCRWAQQNLKGDERTLAIGGLARQWAAKDPVAVLEWLMQTPLVGEERSICSGSLRQLVEICAKKAPDRALEFALKMPEDQPREPIVGGILLIWAKENPAAAKAWLEKAPIAEAKKEVLQKNLKSP